MTFFTAGPVQLALLLLLALPSARPAAAQFEHPPIFLAIPQAFPDLEARAVIMREPGRDIVLLRDTDASPETAQVALDVLARMRREHPRPEGQGQLIPITGFVYRGEMDVSMRAHLESSLAELRRRPLAEIGNLGSGRWMPYQAP